MSSPLVSICIPVYNGEAYLQEALDSVSNQTYINYEIIVSDDGSTDRSLEIVKAFQTDRPIRLIHHPSSGIGGNWNNCIKASKGQYVKFLFQDDILEPTCLEELVKVMEAHPDLAVCASKRRFLLEGEDPFEPVVKRFIEKCADLQKGMQGAEQELLIWDHNVLADPDFFTVPQNKVGEPSVVIIRTSIFEEIGLYREDMKQILDYEFYFRVLAVASIGVINKELAAFRVHGKQASAANFGNADDEKLMLEKQLYENSAHLLSLRMRLQFWYRFSSAGRRLENVQYRLKSFLGLNP